MIPDKPINGTRDHVIWWEGPHIAELIDLCEPLSLFADGKKPDGYCAWRVSEAGRIVERLA